MKRSHLIVVSAVLIIGGAAVMLAAGGLQPGASLRPSVVGLAKAAELPVANPDVVGIFERRDDQSIYVGTHVVRFEQFRECDDCPVHKNIVYDGPVAEVVVTHSTVIYSDITPFDAPVVDGKVQQVLEPGSLDDIGPEALVQVWGEQRGDRLVARIVVYDYGPE